MKESASEEYSDGEVTAGRSIDNSRAQVQAQSKELPHTEDER